MGSGRRAVVEAMFEALSARDMQAARSRWRDDAVWHLEDANDFGGDYTADDYFAMLGRFSAEFGEGYEFRIDSIQEQGDLVVCFGGSTQPRLGVTDGVLIYRVVDDLIAEGWGIGRGADSRNPW